MRRFTVGELLAMSTAEAGAAAGDHVVYVVRDPEEVVLYVGRGEHVVDRIREHVDGSVRSSASLHRILRAYRGSSAWPVDLLTVADCAPMVERYRRDVMRIAREGCSNAPVTFRARPAAPAATLSFELQERAAIWCLRPELNRLSNPNPPLRRSRWVRQHALREQEKADALADLVPVPYAAPAKPSTEGR